MIKYLFLPVISFLLFTGASAQKTNDAVSKQIKALKAEKTFTLSYDQSSNVSKLMAVTENFTDQDAGKVGVQAMNFAIGFMYSGQAIAKAPENILLTFWVLTKKPRFAENHNFLLTGGTSSFDLGSARYAARARENMEYLNFEISRTNLSRIVNDSNVRFQLGTAGFTFTRAQVKAISDLLQLSDPAR